jgi:hypothetical protein
MDIWIQALATAGAVVLFLAIWTWLGALVEDYRYMKRQLNNKK